MKSCPIQEVCRFYTSGDNKPPNNDVRQKFPCKKWLDLSCEMGVKLQEFISGKPIACNLEDVKRKKEKIKAELKEGE